MIHDQGIHSMGGYEIQQNQQQPEGDLLSLSPYGPSMEVFQFGYHRGRFRA